MDRRIAFILNGSAGSNAANEQALELQGLIKTRGINASVLVANENVNLTDLTMSAMAQHCDPIVAGGGDGSMNAIASVLTGTGFTMGVLPMGTFNHFAKDLNIPQDLSQALDTALYGRTVRVDVGQVNGHVFLNNSSLGIYPKLVYHRESLQDRLGLGKWHAAFWAACTVLHRYPFLDVTLATDQGTLTRRSAFVLIGNNEYQMRGLDMFSRSRLTQGTLAMYTSRRTGRLGLLRFTARALFGNLEQTADFDAINTTTLDVLTHKASISVALDGELRILKAPLHYAILPAALQVRVPGEATAQ